MDSNNSLKRIAQNGTREVGDHCVFSKSNYYLPQALIKSFANEVKPQNPPEVRTPSVTDEALEIYLDDPNTFLVDPSAIVKNRGEEDSTDCNGLDVLSRSV